MKLNKKLLLSLVLGFSLLSAIGCTDAQISKFQSLGDSATIKCYSGEKLIFEGKSTGKVKSEANSDGYAFKDAGDGKLKEVSGNCIIEY